MTSGDFKQMIQAKHGRKSGKNREHHLQASCVKWFRYRYPKLKRLLFSIPNGAMLYGSKKQRIAQWIKLESEGAMPGAADLFLSIPSGEYNGLYIEMKTTAKSSKQSDKQKEFEQDVVSQSYGYAIPRTLQQFQNIINSYLSTGTY